MNLLSLTTIAWWIVATLGTTAVTTQPATQPTTQPTTQATARGAISHTALRGLYLRYADVVDEESSGQLEAAADELRQLPVRLGPPPPPQQTDEVSAAATLPAATTAPATQPAAVLSTGAMAQLKALPDGYERQLMALADSLFSAGRIPEAQAVYQELLGRQITGPLKAWTLYQLGNCLRGRDTDEAVKFYERALNAGDDSPWMPAAEASARVTAWRKSSGADAILRTVQRELTSSPEASKVSGGRGAGQ